MTEWDIQPRSSACAACQTPFAEKQTYYTLLGLSGTGHQRRDLCPSCYGSAPRDGVVSSWQWEYQLPLPPPPEPIQKDTAETLLRNLVESSDPSHAAARYILAVMLERKKILRHRDTVRGDGENEVLVYEHAQTGESFTVPDPHLRLDQLGEVQQRVAELLGGQPQPQERTGAEPAMGPAPDVPLG